uniref:CCHC-type domain-containing protein n=1 Tax=Lactuca sativa TaxID=4236 RepID=A0A9R1WJK7_LACSA|nr:hypothetical protein LSAT_V11C100038440 [Lactuca sativa]
MGEKSIPRKTPQVLMIRDGQIKKKKKGKNSKGKPQVGKGKGKKAPQNQPPKKKEMVAKEDTCFECGVVGHWKMNCPKYLIELRKKVEERFRKSRQLKKNEMVVHVGNGAHIGIQAIGYFDLCIPFCMQLTLNNARTINGIYEVSLDDTSNDKYLDHVNTKRVIHGLNQTYLCHCRLEHINKKHISQLQNSRILGEITLDTGREYLSQELQDHIRSCGIT